MRERAFLTALSFLGAAAVLVLISCSPAGKFGKSITVKDKTAIADILDDPGSFDGKTIMVIGHIETVDDDGKGFQLSEGWGRRLLYVKVAGDFKIASAATTRLATAEGKIRLDKDPEKPRLMATGVEVK